MMGRGKIQERTAHLPCYMKGLERDLPTCDLRAALSTGGVQENLESLRRECVGSVQPRASEIANAC